jgi:hypothetical protein
MVAEITDGPGAKRVKVGFKEIPIREDFLTAEKILERAGLDPLEYELRNSDSGQPISPSSTIKIADGMVLGATIKPR